MTHFANSQKQDNFIVTQLMQCLAFLLPETKTKNKFLSGSLLIFDKQYKS